MRDDSNIQSFHYVASTPTTWQRGRTRSEAVDNLRRSIPRASLQQSIVLHGGLSVRTWKVLAPTTALYAMEGGVPMADTEDSREHLIVSLAGLIRGDSVDE